MLVRAPQPLSGCGDCFRHEGERHRPLDINAVNRVGAVKHHKRNTGQLCRLHGQRKSTDVGIKTGADVLDIEHQHIYTAQHVRERAAAGAVQAENGQSGGTVNRRCQFVVGLAPDAVLRAEQRGQVHSWRVEQHVDGADTGSGAAGLVGDQADPFAAQNGKLLSGKDINAGKYLLFGGQRPESEC